ncbi:MAG: hypothetical protein IJ802_05480, partial [Kiritimatiellae bacterium]|nr:hypothetical protein [Kiritimatiellia bacterium]
YGWEVAWDFAAKRLYCKKIADTYAIPGTAAAIANDATLQAWLDADETYQELVEWNWGYDWHDYMEERGANGYPNYLNFILGMSAEESNAKVEAEIKIEDGKVVVSVENSIPNAPTIPAVDVVCTLYEKSDLKSEWNAGERMEGKTATVVPAADARSGFYRVEVAIEEARR